MRSGRLALIPREHSLRLRPHRHTSYAGLAFVLMAVGLVLTGVSVETWAAATNPQSGSVGLSGTVRGAAPSQPAVITSPRNGQHTSSTPVTVAGSCPANTFVQVMRNDVVGGAATCTAEGTFSVPVDLFDGLNRLVARVSDALGQFGPDSAAVEIFYDAPSLSTPGGAVGRQLFLQTTTTVLATSPDQPLTRAVTIVGGLGPYAVAWDWGDGNTTLQSQSIEGATQASHGYGRPGNYRVVVKVTDSVGNTALLQLVTVVNGPVEAIAGSQSGRLGGALLTAWPLYGLAALMVMFFWLGERREVMKLRRKGMISG